MSPTCRCGSRSTGGWPRSRTNATSTVLRPNLVDRFGKLPHEVEHLLQVVAIKALSRRANVEKVEAGPKGIVLSFRDNVFANPEGLIAFIREQGSAVRMRNDPKNAKGQQSYSSRIGRGRRIA